MTVSATQEASAGGDGGVGGRTAVREDLGAGLGGRRMTCGDARPHGRRVLRAHIARRLVPCPAAAAAAVRVLPCAPCGDCGVRLQRRSR